jgi:hypothetical protein
MNRSAVGIALLVLLARPAAGQWSLSVGGGFGWHIARDLATPQGPAVAAELVKGFPSKNPRWGPFVALLDPGSNMRANGGVKVILGSLNPSLVEVSASAAVGVGFDLAERDRWSWDGGFVLGAGGGAALKCSSLWVTLTLDWYVQSLIHRRTSYAVATTGIRIPLSHSSR